ncbi:MAG: hypothetical protein Q4G34_09675 [Micrococcus sp.]|nr:hypothetical protein [Micrococcus sp.]
MRHIITARSARLSAAVAASALLAGSVAAPALAAPTTGSPYVWACWQGNAFDGPGITEGAIFVSTVNHLAADEPLSEGRISVHVQNLGADAGPAQPVDFTLVGDAVIVKGSDLVTSGAQNAAELSVLVDGTTEATVVVNPASTTVVESGCDDDPSYGVVRGQWAISADGSSVYLEQAVEGMSVSAQPAHGTVKQESYTTEEGTTVASAFVYHPQPGFRGVDSVTMQYQAPDGRITRFVRPIAVGTAADFEGVSLGGAFDMVGDEYPELSWVTVAAPATEPAQPTHEPAQDPTAEPAPTVEPAPADDHAAAPAPAPDTTAPAAGEHTVPERVETGPQGPDAWLVGTAVGGAALVLGAGTLLVTRARRQS